MLVHCSLPLIGLPAIGFSPLPSPFFCHDSYEPERVDLLTEEPGQSVLCAMLTVYQSERWLEPAKRLRQT